MSSQKQSDLRVKLQRMMDYPWCREPLRIIPWRRGRGGVFARPEALK
jgi:hypothetical protein